MKKFPKGGIRKSAQEFVDADYLSKLSPEDREWYDNFIKSEYSTNRKAAETLKGQKLTKAEKMKMDKKNYARRWDAYNQLDRRTTAERTKTAIEKIESED